MDRGKAARRRGPRVRWDAGMRGARRHTPLSTRARTGLAACGPDQGRHAHACVPPSPSRLLVRRWRRVMRVRNKAKR